MRKGPHPEGCGPLRIPVSPACHYAGSASRSLWCC